MSQLLQRLLHELEAETDPVRRGELTAQIAAYLARSGLFDEARQRVSELRQAFGEGQSGCVTVWTMLAEGLIHIFSDLGPAGYDRINRAQLLCLAMNYQPGLVVTSAWKAHLDFERSDFVAMIKSIAIVLNNANSTDLDALTRVAMVLSNVYMFCGDRELAQEWFLRGRALAVKNQDQASIEALLYNRTALGLSEMRARKCIDASDLSDLDLKRREVESSKNLQDLIQSGALTNHIQLWSARLSVLEGNFAAAIEKFKEVRGASPFSAYNTNSAFFDLEMAYCLALNSQVEEALEIYAGIEFSELQKLEVDERLVGQWMRSELAKISDRFDNYERLQEDLSSLRGLHVSQMASVSSLLAELAAENPWRFE